MRYRRILLAALVILAVLAAEWLWLRAGREPPPGAGVPAITAHGQSPGGPFALVDHTGKPATDKSFRGKYLVMVFGYTFCPDVCPTTLGTVAAAMDLLGSGADAVQALFVTLDPQRDTPAVLADYVAAFDPRMIGLTGSLEQIRKVARDFRVYFAKVDTGEDAYPVDHSAYIYLIGPDGRTLTYLKHDVTPQVMAGVIARFMARQPSAGQSASAPAS